MHPPTMGAPMGNKNALKHGPYTAPRRPQRRHLQALIGLAPISWSGEGSNQSALLGRNEIGGSSWVLPRLASAHFSGMKKWLRFVEARPLAFFSRYRIFHRYP
jgi:hypothetical protein